MNEPRNINESGDMNEPSKINELKNLVNTLASTHRLQKHEFMDILKYEENADSSKLHQYLFGKAQIARQEYYGNKVYIRGLIEFTNYCKNDCYYCGIRRSNNNASRYRLSKEEILRCCKDGYALGFRTFVLQGGEDNFYADKAIADIVYEIKNRYTDCAVTLSIGEKEKTSYKAYFDAGADRYLLRHETADSEHYSRLHPPNLSLAHRKKCLTDLKEIGFQVGCGIMVGSPFQTIENLAEDLMFMKDFEPEMVGIGPFISHHDTPFAEKSNGTLEQTLFMVALVRLLLPKALLPATTALGTIDTEGRKLGILAGANVVMPNLSPINLRKNYMLYDGKISTGDEAAESINNLKITMKSIGYEVVIDRGDFINNIALRGK